jgi:hypothetical protein
MGGAATDIRGGNTTRPITGNLYISQKLLDCPVDPGPDLLGRIAPLKLSLCAITRLNFQTHGHVSFLA